MARRTFHYVLVLKVWADIEGWDGTEFAVVENTPAFAAWAERRVALFKGLHAIEDGLTDIRYWDYSPYVFNSHDLVEELYDKVCDHEWTWVPHLTVDDNYSVHMSGETVCIDNSGLTWRMYEKHTGTGFSTPTISSVDMRKLLSPVQVLVEAVRKGELHRAEQYYQPYS